MDRFARSMKQFVDTLYLPFSSWDLIGAARDGVARTAIATALAAGALMMARVVWGARLLSGAPPR
ncbi:MAG: hypothetical protein LAP87_00040 [Acidobacteriia bacterium]|nr:hypothetical protein [Terriglobia bacterium]